MSEATETRPQPARWSAVFAVGISVAGLIVAEMLPISLLTPMARDLGITEGTAGLTVTATALVAIFASLFVTTLTRGIDRRHVVMGYSVILVVSGLLTALAVNFPMLIVGRILLGFAVGGLWAMAASLALRLVPADAVPRALAIIFGSSSIATVVAAPLSSVLGDLMGWRAVFGIAAAFGLVCFVWQLVVLPHMPAGRPRNPMAVFGLFRRPGVDVAMLTMGLMFFGQMAFMGYMRPYLEMVADFSVPGVSGTQALVGLSSFLAVSTVAAFLIRRSLKAVLTFAPLAIAAATAAVVLANGQAVPTVVLLGVWGFSFGLVGIAWSTWITRNLADDAENGGGLQVAIIQLANGLGAAAGGVVFDNAGPTGPAVFSGVAFLLAVILMLTVVRTRSATAAPAVAYGH